MELGLGNQRVFISGSSRGIGKAIAYGFLREGAKVFLTGRKEPDLIKTANEFSDHFGQDRILYLCGDLNESGTIDKCKNLAESAWGGIDHVILNTGTGRSQESVLSDPKYWAFMFDENLNSAYKVVREFLPVLQAQKKGNIVFIASIAGQEALGAPIDYSTAKAAVIAFSKNLSRKAAVDNIRVNTVSPGNIYFPGGTWDEYLARDKQKVERMLVERVPMRRFGTPEEIACAVLFLSSQQASFVTGVNLTVDGGQTCAL